MNLLESNFFGLAQSVSFFDLGVLVFSFVDFFLLQKLKRLFQFTSKQRFPFLQRGGFVVLLKF